MNFLLSLVVYAVMGIALVAGILLAVKGSFWLLGAVSLTYLALFIKFGCQAH